jgi:hypothetical protein
MMGAARFGGGLLLVACASGAACAGGREYDTPTLFERTRGSIATVVTFDADGRRTGSGTGFLVRDAGWVATNYHVITGTKRAAVSFGGNRVYPVEGVLAYDDKKDLALLKITLPTFHSLSSLALADAGELRPGAEVVAIGSPLGLDHTISTGTTSGYRFDESANRRVIQHSASISPGSSGGPLLNRRGQVVGINTFFLQKANDLYFAVPSNYLRTLIEDAGDDPILAFAAPPGAPRPGGDASAGGARRSDSSPVFVPINGEDIVFPVPMDYRITRSEQRRNDSLSDDTRYTKYFVASPRAERAEPEGWLSDGIRLYIIYPPQGQVWTEALKPFEDRWLLNDSSFASIVEERPRDTWPVGNRVAAVRIVEGTSPKISEPELAVLASIRSARCWIRWEMAMPKSRRQVLESWMEALGKGFRASCLEAD